MCSSVFFFQAEDGIRDGHVTGVQTCALPISSPYSVSVGYATTSPSRIICAAWAMTAASGSRGSTRSTRGIDLIMVDRLSRSEERRVGKECRSRWWRDDGKKKVRDSVREWRYR